MTVFEYHKKAFLEMKDKPPKERWEYFWEYYKWYAISVLLAIAAIVYTVVTFANRKDEVLFGTLMNSPKDDIQAVSYLDDFYAIAGIDPEEEQILLSTDVNFSDTAGRQAGLDPNQLLVAYVAAEQMDFVTGPDSVFWKCAYNTSNMLADLRDVVDAETLLEWEDRLYYIDREVFEQVRNATSADTMPELPDPRKPEAMADPVPVAIDISDCTTFAESYYSPGQTLYLGIAINAPHFTILRKSSLYHSSFIPTSLGSSLKNQYQGVRLKGGSNSLRLSTFFNPQTSPQYCSAQGKSS